MKDMSKINVTDLTKRFDGEKVLRHINLDIQEGRITSLLSPSGHGKTTLIKCLVGIYVKDDGSIKLDGEEVENLSDVAGYSFQENSFYEDLTVQENLRFYGVQKNVSDEDIAKKGNELLQTLGIHEKKDALAKNLSGGMRKRLDLTLTLIDDPDIVILDEPLAGLNKELRDKIHFLLRELKRAGKTVLLTTHLLEELEDFADDIIIMRDGEITYDGPFEEMESYWKLTIRITSQFDYNLIQEYHYYQEYDEVSIYFETKEEGVELLQKLVDKDAEGIVDLSVKRANVELFMN